MLWLRNMIRREQPSDGFIPFGGYLYFYQVSRCTFSLFVIGILVLVKNVDYQMFSLFI